ncbi:MAG TPA: MarR family transcriptional regulator [Longimicrobiales bacterium]
MSSDRADRIAELFAELRLEQEAVEAFDAAAAELLGIHLTDLRCLGILDRRGALAATELAREAGLTTGATTALIDRLEAAGYVRRVRDERDRRRVYVTLTDAARQAIAEVWGPLGQEGMEVAGRYSAEELALIAEYLRTSREVLRKHLDRLRSMRRRAPPAAGAAPPAR